MEGGGKHPSPPPSATTRQKSPVLIGLKTMKGFKFTETLEVTFEKDTIDSNSGKRVSNYKTAFFNGKAKSITKPSDIEPELNMSRQEILNTIDKWVKVLDG